MLIFGCILIAMGGWNLYKHARESLPIREKVSTDNVWAAATGDLAGAAVDDSSKSGDHNPRTTAVAKKLGLVAVFAIVLVAGMWVKIREEERIRNRNRNRVLRPRRLPEFVHIPIRRLKCS